MLLISRASTRLIHRVETDFRTRSIIKLAPTIVRANPKQLLLDGGMRTLAIISPTSLGVHRQWVGKTFGRGTQFGFGHVVLSWPQDEVGDSSASHQDGQSDECDCRPLPF